MTEPSSDFGPWARLVRADNPGLMTLDGTNTWVLRPPGSGATVVVDPGPLDEGHLQAVLAAATADGARVEAVLLTHHHFDHAEGAPRFAELSGAPVYGAEHGWDDFRPSAAWDGGLRTVATPGHTADSTSLLLEPAGLLLTGDTVLGRGTTIIAEPDGHLGEYLRSLDVLAGVVATHDVRWLLPGHGPARENPAGVVLEYQQHRRTRLDQVSAAHAAGARTARAVVEVVYADVPQELWGAAEVSVQAQLDYLGL
ncbi:MBL fold metallo-hydrolase [Spongisporangium articulatum]|uniref:MBL fold metallo-hydrolase n=1 Tax=Spongisporangium articulatum TaxID=3362603 RepID=A0ABW8AKX0_9ACTN